MSDRVEPERPHHAAGMDDVVCRLVVDDLAHLGAKTHVVLKVLLRLLVIEPLLVHDGGRRNVVAPNPAIRLGHGNEPVVGAVLVNPLPGTRGDRGNSTTCIPREADAATIAGVNAVELATHPLVAHPVAESVDDLAGVQKHLVARQARVSRRIVWLDGGVGLIVAYHHPVEVVLRAIRGMPQEALAGLPALKVGQTGEEPPVLRVPGRGHTNVGPGLPRVPRRAEKFATFAPRD